jgi:hypothetical protein
LTIQKLPLLSDHFFTVVISKEGKNHFLKNFQKEAQSKQQANAVKDGRLKKHLLI